MNYVGVYVEHASLSLNQMFTYQTEENVQPGCRVRVPFGHQTLVGFVGNIQDKPEFDRIKSIIEVIDQQPILNQEQLELADWMSKFYVCSKISCYKSMLPPALKPSSSHASIIYEDWAIKSIGTQPLTVKQQEVYETTTFPLKASIFRKEAKSIAKVLIDKGYVVLEKREKEIDIDTQQYEDTSFSLTQQQKDAIHSISQTEQTVSLLHGVTGSGKTEVFLQLAKQTLEKNQQVLFLVPEIGLTPMMIQRVKARFKERIAIYHSQLNAQEKYNQYQKVKNGQADIVIGTRSSIFMPLDRLGLILMDEEHDASYKQDSSPRYHTRDVVLWLANKHHCKVVLSSATPSLESYSRAYKKQYQLVELKNRIYQQMPSISLIDMKGQKVTNGLSQTLIDSIQERLDQHEQVILLLNRRGYLPIVRCMDCNTVLSCKECGLALSYHKKENVLMCHCCGTMYSFHHECPHCHGHHFYQATLGTEKLQESLQEMFPSAHIVRMDADSTRKKNAHSKKLKEFETQGDILLGTQMVAKGLDFPRVTLVGILNADAALTRTDYRSAETAFDLLVQASGRSGREKKAGNVLIQTFDPSHYVMHCVKDHNYSSFFNKEMSFRHIGQYPPYVYLCTLIFQHPSIQGATNAANRIKEEFNDYKILGPIEVSMRQRQNRVRLILKSKSQEELNSIVWKVVDVHNVMNTGVKLDINMYPMSLED